MSDDTQRKDAQHKTQEEPPEIVAMRKVCESLEALEPVARPRVVKACAILLDVDLQDRRRA